MDWSSYLGLKNLGAQVPEVKATEPWSKFSARSGGWTRRIGGHLSHSCREHRGVTPAAYDPPTFCTGGEDTCEIRPREQGEPEARHRGSVRALPKPRG